MFIIKCMNIFHTIKVQSSRNNNFPAGIWRFVIFQHFKSQGLIGYPNLYNLISGPFCMWAIGVENTVLVLADHSLSDRIRVFVIEWPQRQLLSQGFQQQIKQCNENKQSYNLCQRAGVKIIYRVDQKKVYTCMPQTLTSHKSHFLLIFDGKTYINEKDIHERVYFSVCLP